MRFQIKKILEGYDPAELIEQSMYCFGSDDGNDDNTSTDEDFNDSTDIGNNTSNVGNDTGSDNNTVEVSREERMSPGRATAQFGSEIGNVAGGYTPSQVQSAIDNNQLGLSVADIARTAPVPIEPVISAPTVLALDPMATDRSPARMGAVFGQDVASSLGGLTPNEVMNISGITSPSQTGEIPVIDNGFENRQLSSLVNRTLGRDEFVNPVPIETPEVTAPIPIVNPNVIESPLSAFAPDTLDIQEFAREQDYFDANPMSTLADAPYTTGFNVNVGAGDIFNTKDSIRSQVGMGGDPVYNPDGSIGGVVGSSRFAPVTGALPAFMSNLLPDAQVYTGRPELNPFGDPTMGSDNNEPQTTPPISNPITGKEQCPDGYVFDTDLQACRLKTRADDAMGTPKNPPDINAPAFTRNYSLLNTAPSNLPQGFNYNQANQNFMSRFATRPSIFKNPPNLLGFTPFRSS